MPQGGSEQHLQREWGLTSGFPVRKDGHRCSLNNWVHPAGRAEGQPRKERWMQNSAVQTVHMLCCEHGRAGGKADFAEQSSAFRFGKGCSNFHLQSTTHSYQRIWGGGGGVSLQELHLKDWVRLLQLLTEHFGSQSITCFMPPMSSVKIFWLYLGHQDSPPLPLAWVWHHASFFLSLNQWKPSSIISLKATPVQTVSLFNSHKKETPIKMAWKFGVDG